MSGKINSNLHTLFNPQSVAVIGASRHPKKLGHIVLQNLRGGHFPNGLFPINPETKTISGLTCYSTIESLPTVPDLAIIVIPASLVITALSAAARFGIKNFVILSAGFKEIGSDGTTRELALQSLAHTYQLNILGPNCLGFLNTQKKINATFASNDILPGEVDIVSQSGAMASGLFDWARNANIGLHRAITLGNKTILSETEILSYIHDSTPTSTAPIGMYLESIEQGEAFIQMSKKISQQRPIILLKPGKSETAQRAISSHTGAIAQSDMVLDVALKRSGIIRVSGTEDWFDLIRITSWTPAPQGKNIAIVSNAGGPSVIATDTAAECGLTLAPLSQKTRDLLARSLPREANIANPIDILGDALADRYRAALQAVLAESTVDAVMIILTPQVMTQIESTAAVIAELAQKHRKPILCSFMGGSHISAGERILHHYHIPSFRYPERAIKSLSAYANWHTWRQAALAQSRHPMVQNHLKFETKKHIIQTIRSTKKQHIEVLPSLESDKILQSLHVTVPPSTKVTTMLSALHFANRYGYPLVAKISSPYLPHKSDAHGLVANIHNHESLHHAVRQLQNAIHTLGLTHLPETNIQLQKQVTNGIELILGMRRDPNFGPVWIIGAGGIFTELMGDHALAMPPFSRANIAAWIHTTKISKVLMGARGHGPYAIHALTDLIIQLLPLGDILDIVDITINPIIVTASQAYAIDTRITISNHSPV